VCACVYACVCVCVCVCVDARVVASCAPFPQIVSAQLQSGQKSAPRAGSVNTGPTASFLFRKVAAPVAVEATQALGSTAIAEEAAGDDGDDEGDGLIYDDATVGVGDEPDENEEEAEEEVVKPLTAADQVHAIQVANELGETRTVQLSKSPTGADMQLLVDAQCVRPCAPLRYTTPYSLPSIPLSNLYLLCLCHWARR
jgi:hypothetical protein